MGVVTDFGASDSKVVRLVRDYKRSAEHLGLGFDDWLNNVLDEQVETAAMPVTYLQRGRNKLVRLDPEGDKAAARADSKTACPACGQGVARHCATGARLPHVCRGAA